MRMKHPQVRMLTFQFLITLAGASYWLISRWSPAGWMVLGQVIIEGFIFFGVMFKVVKSILGVLGHNVKKEDADD